MRTPTVTAEWRLTLGLAAAVIALVAGGTWWLSALHKDVQGLKDSAAQTSDAFKELKADLKAISAIATDVAEIKGQLKSLRRPVYQTSRDVNAIGHELAQLNRSLHPFQSVLEGPLTQN